MDGLIFNKEAKKKGISRAFLAKEAKQGNIIRVQKGVYITPNEPIDDLYIFQKNIRVLYFHIQLLCSLMI